jgi:hypothetical protein
MLVKPGKDISVDMSRRVTYDKLCPVRVADIKIDRGFDLPAIKTVTIKIKFDIK